MELIWGPAKEPRTLARSCSCYMVATLVGSRVFGAEAWLGNVELFSCLLADAVALLAARAAAVRRPRSGRRRRRRSGRRACVPTAPGCAPIRALPVGGGAFVLAALATVVFDGWSQTDRFGGFQQWFCDRWSFLAHHVDVLQTLSMVAVVAIFVVGVPPDHARHGPRRSRRR